MSDKLSMPGVFITDAQGDDLKTVMSHMDKLMQDWTMRAARGECAWVCTDCGISYPDGMPGQCAHSYQSCTDIIQRDKRDAIQQSEESSDD